MMEDLPLRQEALPRPGLRGRMAAAAVALAAGILAWAAVPVSGGRAGTWLAVVAGGLCAVLTAAQLGLGRFDFRREPFQPLLERFAVHLLQRCQTGPWPEGLVIAALAAEALHHSRPWHTAILGAALAAFLLAVHCSESEAPPLVLRPQLPLLAAGLGLLVLAAGWSALPAPGTGSAAVVLRVLAAVAALVAGALALPL